MKRYPVLTISILFLILCTLVVPVVATKKKKQQTTWPNLTNINVGNPQMCNIDGAAQHGTEKAKLNDLKNRFRLPNGSFETVTFDGLLAMKQGHIGGDTIVDFPGSSDLGNTKAVTLEGYGNRVSVGGCASGESCNCKSQNSAFCDTHIDVYPDKNSVTSDGHNMFVVEITQRSRLLAGQGLLSSNVGNDWSTVILKPKLEKHRVRFSGYLYFDTDHSNEAWASDPDDKVKKVDSHGKVTWGNWRQTCWEVHPVMKIEVLP
jgi:hypothetical protein